MSGTPTQLFTLFTGNPGELLYFLWVIVFSQAALLMAIGQRLRGRVERSAGRYLMASLGVMSGWVILMVAAWAVVLTGKTGDSANAILSPLNQAVNALIVLLIGWAFLTADLQPARLQAKTLQPTGRWISILTGVLSVLLVGAYIFTAVQWYRGTPPFTPHLFELAWTIGITVLAGLVLVLLAVRFRITVDAPLKIIFFAFITAGYAYALVMFLTSPQTTSADTTGILRLAFLVAMPLLPVVVYRMVTNRLLTIIEERTTAARQAIFNPPAPASNLPMLDTSAERESVTLLKTLGMMLERETPEDLPLQIVMATANVLKADVTALISVDDPEYGDIISAYDNIRQQSIAAMALKMDEQPLLREAIITRSQQPLIGERNLNEMVDLYTRLDIQKIGPAYFQPLTREGELLGVMLVALPYTQRELRENETQLLEAVAPIAARLLALSRAAKRAREGRSVQDIIDSTQSEGEVSVPVSTARAEIQANLELARNQISDLTGKVRDLQIELDFERGRLAEIGANDPEGLSITQRLERMHHERDQLEAERERLMQALQEAQTRLATVSGNEDQVYEAAIRVLQTERDQLQAQKTQLENQLTEIRAAGQSGTPTVLRELLTNLSDDKARLAIERDLIKTQLEDVESQLQALGIEGGPKGLATILVQLNDERSQYKALAERAVHERDALLEERHHFGDQIANEAQRDTQIAAMMTELRRLAEDNEVLLRQRDSLRQEREHYNSDREAWEGLRTRMTADLATIQSDLEEATFERNRITTERNKLAQERTSLISERDQLIALQTALQTERDQLLARVEGNRDSVQRLGEDGVGALKKMIDDLTEERSELEHQILRMEHQIENLQESLSKANAKLSQSVPVPTSASVSSSQAEVMLSIAQELRTPMSSIGGYVDLLLGESVGILGASQRQFLQRIKSNADRAHNLIEDFVRVTAIDTGQLRLSLENVDMLDIIDDGITATRTQFREKGIILRMDLPKELPTLRGDIDALRQVIIELLSNSYRASPTDGEVMISAKFQPGYKMPSGNNGKSDSRADVIFISVRDMGGGIPPEEQSRVFSRLYRADNPLIQGLGDTGVGLSIARAMVEAHGGRIWLESVPGEGSIFKLIIPVESRSEKEKAPQTIS